MFEGLIASSKTGVVIGIVDDFVFPNFDLSATSGHHISLCGKFVPNCHTTIHCSADQKHAFNETQTKQLRLKSTYHDRPPLICPLIWMGQENQLFIRQRRINRLNLVLPNCDHLVFLLVSQRRQDDNFVLCRVKFINFNFFFTSLCIINIAQEFSSISSRNENSVVVKPYLCMFVCVCLFLFVERNKNGTELLSVVLSTREGLPACWSSLHHSYPRH